MSTLPVPFIDPRLLRTGTCRAPRLQVPSTSICPVVAVTACLPAVLVVCHLMSLWMLEVRCTILSCALYCVWMLAGNPTRVRSCPRKASPTLQCSWTPSPPYRGSTPPSRTSTGPTAPYYPSFQSCRGWSARARPPWPPSPRPPPAGAVFIHLSCGCCHGMSAWACFPAVLVAIHYLFEAQNLDV